MPGLVWGDWGPAINVVVACGMLFVWKTKKTPPES
jgi:hypothetical protein